MTPISARYNVSNFFIRSHSTLHKRIDCGDSKNSNIGLFFTVVVEVAAAQLSDLILKNYT